MASILDFLMNNAGDIADVGGGIYDIYQSSQAADRAESLMEPGGVVDPFGGERPYYQQQLRNLYQDPSSLSNLPGYKFALSEMTRNVNRQAAKGGQFGGTGRLHAITERTAGLADLFYQKEADRLAKLAGADIAGSPQGALAALSYGQGARQDMSTQAGSIMDILLGGGSGGGGPQEQYQGNIGLTDIFDTGKTIYQSTQDGGLLNKGFDFGKSFFNQGGGATGTSLIAGFGGPAAQAAAGYGAGSAGAMAPGGFFSSVGGGTTATGATGGSLLSGVGGVAGAAAIAAPFAAALYGGLKSHSKKKAERQTAKDWGAMIRTSPREERTVDGRSLTTVNTPDGLFGFDPQAWNIVKTEAELKQGLPTYKLSSEGTIADQGLLSVWEGFQPFSQMSQFIPETPGTDGKYDLFSGKSGRVGSVDEYWQNLADQQAMIKAKEAKGIRPNERVITRKSGKKYIVSGDPTEETYSQRRFSSQPESTKGR